MTLLIWERTDIAARDSGVALRRLGQEPLPQQWLQIARIVVERNKRVWGHQQTGSGAGCLLEAKQLTALTQQSRIGTSGIAASPGLHATKRAHANRIQFRTKSHSSDIKIAANLTLGQAGCVVESAVGGEGSETVARIPECAGKANHRDLETTCGAGHIVGVGASGGKVLRVGLKHGRGKGRRW